MKCCSPDHEYGAVTRIWQRACASRSASVTVAQLPVPARTADEWIDAIFAAVNERTRLIVISHVSSPTALELASRADLPPRPRTGHAGLH